MSITRWLVSIGLVTLVLAMETPGQAIETLILSAGQRQGLGIELQSPVPVLSLPVGLVPALVTVPPENHHVISAPLAGLVDEVKVSQGESVRRGQVLVMLDSPELLQHQQHLIDAWNELTVAQARHDRDGKLLQAGIIARKRWLETEKTWRQSRTAFAQAKRELIVMGFTPAEIDRLWKTGRLDSHIALRAPVDGVVTAHRVSVGERVGRADALLKVTALRPLLLEMAVPAALADRMVPGVGVKVEGQDARGAVLLVASTVDPQTQTVLVRAELTESGGLQPGRKVTASLTIPASDVLQLPRSALLEHQGKSFVFVQTADGFEVRPVAVAAMTDDAVFVEQGVQADESIAIKGVAALKASWLGVGEGE